MAADTPPSRNRYVDWLRALSISAVVLGHWLIAAPWIAEDGLRLDHMLAVQPWTQWLTLLFQVMPVFFLVGGYSNAASWDAAQRSGTPYGTWVAGRARRLIGPVVPLILAWAAIAFVFRRFGVSYEMIKHGSILALVPMWFLAVYLLVVLLVPVTRAAWRRFGVWSYWLPVALAVVVDVLRFHDGHRPAIATHDPLMIEAAKSKAEEMLRDTNRMIENTIRSIRETQAEKEKTREVREELDSFREHLASAEKQPAVTLPEAPQLKSSTAGIVRRISKQTPKPVVKKKPDKVSPGDYVRITGSDTVGEVTEVKGKKLQLISNNLKMSVDIDRTEPVSASEYRKAAGSGRPQPKIDWSQNVSRNQFNPEIDVRGMRTEEALQAVQEFIDTALMIQFRHLRILHGKGNGILRQMIRQYLESTGAVSSAIDEHVDRGGAGITVVELDV